MHHFSYQICKKIIPAGPANILYRSASGETGTWCNGNPPYRSVLSVHTYPIPAVDYPIPVEPDSAHPYRIPGADNLYNHRWTSLASHASIFSHGKGK
jgi:hypothetical protein